MSRAPLLLLLLPLLTSCPQSIEPACGLEGEGCCAGACEEGLACIDERCEPCPAGGCGGCGVEGAACCDAAPACGDGLRCAESTCILSCGDGCDPQSERCSGDGLPQLCILDPEAPSCTVWLSLPGCEDRQVCRDGGCTDACETSCVPDEEMCGPSGLLRCRVDPLTRCPDWTAVDWPDGENVCVGGACVDLFCWENPLPAGGYVSQFLADESDSQLALDAFGNTLLLTGGQWAYDYRARDAQSPRLLRVEACDHVTGSLGISDRDLYRRTIGGWRIEPRPTLVGQLDALTCAGARFALSSDGGDLLFVDGEESLVIDVAAAGHLERLAIDPIEDVIYAGGAEVPGVLRCSISRGPMRASCRLEVPRNFVPGQGVVELGVDATGMVFAATRDGNVFEREEGDWSDGHLSTDGQPTALRVFPDRSVWLGSAVGQVHARSPGEGWRLVRQFSPSPIVGFGRGASRLFASDDRLQVFSLDPEKVDAAALITTTSVTRKDLFDVDANDARDVYAVGETGTILHRRGEVWRREAEGLTNVNLYAVVVVSPGEVYAFGDAGTILARRNGVWSLESEELTEQSLFAAFTDGHMVFAGGGEGVLLERPVGPTPDVWEVARRSEAGTLPIAAITGHATSGVGAADEVIAVDGSCELTVRSPIGVVREALPRCDDPPYLAVFDDLGDLFLAGGFFPTTVYRRTAGDWSSEPLSLESASALFASGRDLWLVGANGEIYVHQSGQWRTQTPGLVAPDYGGVATPSGDVFLVGTEGRIWHRR